MEKPSGLLTVDVTGQGGVNAATQLMEHIARKKRSEKWAKLKEQAKVEGKDELSVAEPALPKVRLGPNGVGVIHRLDREASGLMVFSLSPRGYNWLKDDFKTKRVHRLYLALVEGKLGEVGQAGTIQSFIREMEDGSVLAIGMDQISTHMGMGPASEGMPKMAVTHYRVLGQSEKYTLVQARLSSGRKNQIRAHMAFKGHPLVGDMKFKAGSNPLGRVGLHATELGFAHPGTGQQVRFSSPAPAEFYRLVGMNVPEASKQAEAMVPVMPADKPADTSWNAVAAWYDNLQEDRKNDHYSEVIIPGTLRLVGPHAGMKILDVACGQGSVSRAMMELGAEVVGVDSAERLVDAARARSEGMAGGFFVGDATRLDDLDLGVEGEAFDAATCIMALMNIDPLEPCFAGIARRLKPGGALVAVISHPVFRIPGQTAWGFDPQAKPHAPGGTQFRRIDGYLSTGQMAITMHPGQDASIVTYTFHRPLQAYIKALAEAGMMVEGIEEWISQRQSQPGPRADAENRARREIPLFMAIRARKMGPVEE